MGLRRMTTINHSHSLHKIKQQVGECIVEAFLVLGQATGKLKLTRLITTWTWEKPPPSPL
jgi:hypothetical protein